MTPAEANFPKPAPKPKVNIAQLVQAFVGNKAEQRHVGGIVALVLGALFHKNLGSSPTDILMAAGGLVVAFESLGEHFGLKL